MKAGAAGLQLPWFGSQFTVCVFVLVSWNSQFHSELLRDKQKKRLKQVAEKNSNGDLCNMPTSLLLVSRRVARDIDSGLHLLSCDNMKNNLRDVVFLYAAKSRQEEEK